MKCLSALLAATGIAVGAAAGAAAAPQPYLFANLLTGDQIGGDSFPSLFPQPVGGLNLFIADDGVYGHELWATDGTSRGTWLLADLCPGSCEFLSFRSVMVVRPDLAFFISNEHDAESGEYSRRLWRTDGTTEGTRQLVHSASDDALGSLVWMPEVGRLLFANDRAAEGLELWSSDGTVAGTGVLKDIHPGPVGSKTYLREAGGRVWVSADDGVHGTELWITDGTAAGTRLVFDANPGPEGSGATPLGAVAGNELLYAVFQEETGLTLWVSDGTAAGTRFVKDLHHHRFSYYLRATSDGERVFFFTEEDVPYNVSASYHLWASDGTPAGTRQLTTRGELTSLDVYDREPVVIGNDRVVFDWYREDLGLEPWLTDGTPEGTGPLGDLCPGDCDSRSSRMFGYDYRVFDGHAYFSAFDPEHGRELWVTDGTPAGTHRLVDSCPGSCSAVYAEVSIFIVPQGLLYSAFTGSGGALLFTDGVAPPTPLVEGVDKLWSAAPRADGDGLMLGLDAAGSGIDLWTSDLTTAGTRLVRDLDPGHDPGSQPQPVAQTAGALFLVTSPEDLSASHLWTTDGTPGGTHLVEGVPAEVAAALPDTGTTWAATSDHVFLLIEDADASDATLHPWSLDVAAGTWTQLPPVELGHQAQAFALDDALVVLGRGAWVSDGSVAGTSTYDGTDRDSGDPAAVVGDAVIFTATNTQNYLHGLWRIDAGGPVPLRTLGEEASGEVEAMAAWNDAAAFVFDGRLWTSDGTAAGTQPLFALPFERPVESLAATPGALFFVVGYGDLWSSDGTAAGTRDLDLYVGTPAVVGDRLLVRGVRGGDGSAWWTSDGTAAGTIPLGGPLATGFNHLTSLATPLGDYAVVIRALSSYGPWEVILTDGTEAGTRVLGSFESSGANDRHGPSGFSRLGDTVLFNAFDDRAGKELWAFELDGSPPQVTPEPCVADDETLCLLDGHFRVRAEWRDPRSGREGTAGARPFPGSDRTGVFWFFDPANVELIVKQLDGSGINGFYWTFWGALTDVEYWIEVRDMERRADRTFHNPPLTVCGRGETAAFPAELATAAAATPDCADAGTLCLHDDRFAVAVDWRDPRTGNTGSGTAIPGTDRSGYFWFFRDDNVELVVKVLDGRPVNGHWWVFYGALTDVEYTLRVVDSESGSERSYHNPPGRICGKADTGAF